MGLLVLRLLPLSHVAIAIRTCEAVAHRRLAIASNVLPKSVVSVTEGWAVVGPLLAPGLEMGNAATRVTLSSLCRTRSGGIAHSARGA